MRKLVVKKFSFTLLLYYCISLFLSPLSLSAQEEEVVVETVEEDVSAEEDTPFVLPDEDETDFVDTWADLESTSSAWRVTSLSSLGLPDVLILPTSPFYFLKELYETVRLFLTSSPEKKAELTLQGAENRLAETYRLIEDKEFEKAKETLGKYEELITKAVDLLPSLKEKIDEVELKQIVRKIEANTVKQQAVIAYYDKKVGVTAGAYDEMDVMKINGLEKAIEALVETNMATPSYELKKKIKEVITSDEYEKEVKTQIEIKMNEKLRREIRKEEMGETTESSSLIDSN